MTSNIVLHIGLHKTATGTLQRQFFPNCKDMSLFTTRVPEMQAFVNYVTRTDPLYFDSKHARNLLMPVLDAHKPNMLSNESFSGPPYAGVIEGGLDHRQPVLNNLKKAFPKAKAILVLRRQDSLAKSFYRQYLKSGGTRTATRFFGMEGDGKPALFSLDRMRFSPYVDAVHEAFPEGVLTLVYEEFSSDQERFLNRIAEFVGFSPPKMALQRENATTLGPVGMEVTRFLNHFFRSLLNPAGLIPGVNLTVRGRKRRISPVQLLHDHFPSRNTIHQAGSVVNVSRTILQQVKEDNRLLDQKYRLNLDKYSFY